MQNPLSKIILPVKGKIALAIALLAVSVVCKVVAFCFFAFIISSLVVGNFSSWLLFVAFVLVFAELLFRLFGFGVSHKAAFALEQILREQISAQMAKIPYGEVLNLGTGELKKIMLDDVRALHTYVADTTPYFGSLSVMPIACLVALFWFDYKMLLVVLAMFFVGVFVMIFAFKDNEKYRQKYDDAQGKINASIIEFIQAMAVVRTFANAQNSFGKYDDALKNYSNSLKEWISFSSFPSRLGMAILSPIPTYFALCVAGAVFYTNGSLSLGDLVGSLLVGTGLVSTFMPLMMMRNFLMKSKASAIRILEFLEISPLAEATNPKIPENFEICFKNVSFKYPKKDEFALQDINFIAKSGCVTAFVGASGAGKSTAATLMARFYDVSGGEISIGGINIKEISQEKLCELVSFVFQDTFLFNESIYENIAKAKPNATKDEVIAAAKAAGIDEFIQNLPNGYDTIASERGVNLSGGERQRITIARAILRDAPIIILDEATAFADPQSEEQIVKAIANLIKNKTTIIIAHRLLTIAGADKILVFDKGKICEQGKHNELIEQNGIYAGLWQNYQDSQIWGIRGENAK